MREHRVAARFYFFAFVTLSFGPSSPPSFELWSASRATADDASSVNSTNAMFFLPGIVRTSIKFGYLFSFEVRRHSFVWEGGHTVDCRGY